MNKLFARLLISGLAVAAPVGLCSAATTSAVAVAADAEFAAFAALISGSWKTTQPIGATDTTPGQEVVMSVAPVALEGLTDTFYVELANAATLHNPYRQVILQAYRANGKFNLRTMELRRPGGRLGSVIGLWAAPEAFPKMKMDDLLGTLDLTLTSDGAGGFLGRTAAPFPTSTGGASTMTSEMAIGAYGLKLADRGFDADGKLVWGPASGEWYPFTKFDAKVKTSRFEGGVVAIDFPVASLGEPASSEQTVVCHYVGYLQDGSIFDRSYDRGEPLRYGKTMKLIPGWNAAMEETRKGMKRRLVIPGPMAYGEAGRKPLIPSNATLFFDMEVVDILTPPPAPVQPSISTTPEAPKPAVTDAPKGE